MRVAQSATEFKRCGTPFRIASIIKPLSYAAITSDVAAILSSERTLIIRPSPAMTP